MVTEFAENNGFSFKGLDFSPVKGPEGNIEYLLYIKKTEDMDEQDDKQSEDIVRIDDSRIDEVVTLSHETLDK